MSLLELALGGEHLARISASLWRAGSEEDGYRLTRDFVIAMMEHFRRQKTIHRRFAFQIVLEVRARAAARHARRLSPESQPGSACPERGRWKAPARRLLPLVGTGSRPVAVHTALGENI
jgi:hypothetical protein